jgi:hypothetical protein
MPAESVFQFADTLAQSQEVDGVLASLRERVAAGEPLPQPLALALLDAIIDARPRHLDGPHERSYAPGDTYEVCGGCGQQVTGVWRGRGAVPQEDPGTCPHLRDTNYLVRRALRMPLPTRQEYSAEHAAQPAAAPGAGQ